MEYLKKSGFAKTFSIWFGIGAFMFGTYCGANMASGVYASAYIVTLGGGWSLVWLSIFFAFMTFFCAISLVFIRIYKVKNYNQYYLALYGLHKPDANPLLRGGVTVFFDIFTMLKGLVNVPQLLCSPSLCMLSWAFLYWWAVPWVSCSLPF